MREIKFRAWDGRSMIQWEVFRKTSMRAFDDSELSIMQFTGLKDKKGREIYEGDIVLAHYYKKGEPVGRRQRWLVEWNPHYMNGWSRSHKGDYLPLMSAVEED